LRPRRPERVASLLNLFCNLPLVRLLFHQLLGFLALLFSLVLACLEIDFLTDSSSFFKLDFLLVLLQLDLHVEHFAHFQLLLLSTLFL
jgi:hypothetical protein